RKLTTQNTESAEDTHKLRIFGGFSATVLPRLTRFSSDHYHAHVIQNPAKTFSLMRIYDVSVPLSPKTPVYPGDPGIEISSWKSLANGDTANVSLLHFGAHSGTHVDAPSHFIAGAARVESLPLSVLIGAAEVIEVPESVSTIDANFISEHCRPRVERVIFKTRNSGYWNGEVGFRTDYAHLDPGAATQLVKQGAKLVGIDYLSIEQFGSEKYETHLALLNNGVVILEGVDLREIAAGFYELICLPLRISGGTGDGAPARVVLRTLT
ncbi:MAG: cyclase family protein, partial [Pyrinomonadaceae bacterium]